MNIEDIEIKRDLSSHEPGVEHEFIMTLSDETITGPYGDLTFNKGVSKFGLKGGESVTVSDLPAGVNYKVVAEIQCRPFQSQFQW